MRKFMPQETVLVESSPGKLWEGKVLYQKPGTWNYYYVLNEANGFTYTVWWNEMI